MVWSADATPTEPELPVEEGAPARAARWADPALRAHLENRAAENLLDPAVLELYERIGGRPLWTKPTQRLAAADALLALLRSLPGEGIPEAPYNPAAVASLLDDLYADGAPPDDRRFAIEQKLTEALLRVARDLAGGRVDPRKAGLDWHIRPGTEGVVGAIAAALGTNTLATLARDLGPRDPAYARLRALLPVYKGYVERGGWRPVPSGPKLEIGRQDSIERLARLEQRLVYEGFLEEERIATPVVASEETLRLRARYGERLAAAVRRFQRAYGIGPDGIVGPKTMRELNVPATERLRQIELNLERWRWLPRSFGERYLMVNAPAYELSLYERGARVQRMAVVVGRKDWPTPVFADQVEYVVVNPHWNVPKKIAAEELVPKLRRDPEFLQREGYVLTDLAGNPVTVDPNDLLSVTHKTHYFRQLPSDLNALGRLKFVFPNKFDVYLHDTPNRNLFQRSEAAFSHGCVRVQKPVELAMFLLGPESRWTQKRLAESIASRENKWIRLRDAVPIYIVYFTAGADEEGRARFWPDIYEMDTTLAAALDAMDARPVSRLVSTEP